MEVGFKYNFGELKAGDKFAWHGAEYEKISGNCAIEIYSNKIVEFENTLVYLYEVY